MLARTPPGSRKRTKIEDVNTVHLTDDELRLARHAMQAYLLAFGHNEADTMAQIKKVIVKFRDAEPEDEAPHFIA